MELWSLPRETEPGAADINPRANHTSSYYRHCLQYPKVVTYTQGRTASETSHSQNWRDGTSWIGFHRLTMQQSGSPISESIDIKRT